MVIPNWCDETNCAITVCDKDCIILYMNKKAIETFSKRGNLIGKNLLECHNENSIKVIKKLLAEGGTNTYTIEKAGLRKMIFQSAWYNNGKIAGLVEISMVLPDEIPHHIRS